MADPVIPNVPSNSDASQVQFLMALKGSIEYLMGQGRFKNADRAVKVRELEALASRIDQDIVTATTTSETVGDAPDPPTNLIVTKGVFVHILTWDNPADVTVWYIEIWAAEGSQVRDNARLEGVYTVTEETRGKQGTFKHSGFDVTSDMTYWIRSVSYTGLHSSWCPPDAQGGYVVPGDESLQTAIDGVLAILNGNITENELYIDLSTRINLIDNPGTGLVDRLTTIELNIDALEEFDTGGTYAVDDVHTYLGKVYICIQATSNPAALPTDENYWEKIGESASLAGNISANSTAISFLDARVEENEDDILAYATLLTGLRSDVGDNAAAITTESTTRATADSANAQNINTVSTQINDPVTGLPSTYAAVQQSLGSIDGIKAKYALKVDVNGHVVGFELINDGTTGEFVVLADKFKFIMPDGSGNPIAIVSAGLVDGDPTLGIDGNMVIDGTVLTRHLQAGTIKAWHLDAQEIFVGLTLQSTNYISGTSGWRINNETGEFNDMVFSFNGLSDKPTSLGDINIDEAARLDSISAPVPYAWAEGMTIEADHTVTKTFDGGYSGGCVIQITVPDDYAGGLEVSFNGENLTNEVWDNGVLGDGVGQVLNLTEEGETVNLGSLY